MPSLNVWHGMGNLTQDVDLRYTQGGKAVASFTVAVNYGSGDRAETLFMSVTAWEEKAENLAQFVKKGSPIYVQGRIKLDSWVDQNSGQERSKLTLVLSQFQLLAPRDTDQSGYQAPPGHQQQQQAGPPPAGQYQQQQMAPPPQQQQQYAPQQQQQVAAQRQQGYQQPPQQQQQVAGQRNQYQQQQYAAPPTDNISDDEIPF